MTKYISTYTGAQVDEAIEWIRDIFDGTDLANIGDLSMSGTIDLGTNTIYDGNMTGNWAMNGGNVSGMGTLGCGAITSSGKIETTSTDSDSIKTAGGIEVAGDIYTTAWTDWTPVFSSSGGANVPTMTALTTGYYCKYKEVGDLVFVQARIKITQHASPSSGVLSMSLPVEAIQTNVGLIGKYNVGNTYDGDFFGGNIAGTSLTVVHATSYVNSNDLTDGKHMLFCFSYRKDPS
jgi:hypothetical protein